MSEVASAVPATLGARVRALREARGLFQSQLAEELGVSASMVCRLETGSRRPSRALLGVLIEWFQADGDADELATACGVMPADLQQLLSRDYEAVQTVRRMLKEKTAS